jgi:hypothetical protein
VSKKLKRRLRRAQRRAKHRNDDVLSWVEIRAMKLDPPDASFYDRYSKREG